jgi:hypothetical protein
MSLQLMNAVPKAIDLASELLYILAEKYVVVKSDTG